MTALALPVVLAAVGFAVDYGFILRTRTELQKDADAMALAGARVLCGTLVCDTEAESDALAWGDSNGVQATDSVEVLFNETCEGTPTPNHDHITVKIERNQPSFFAKIVGFSGGDIPACATARAGVAAAGPGLLPFGFHEVDPYPGANPDNVCYMNETSGGERSGLWGSSCLIKIPKIEDSWGSGNSGPIRLDEGGPSTNYDGDCNPGSSGASEYEENIEDGSECWYAAGDEVTPKTGNMRGPTCDAFNTRLAGNSESLADVFGAADSNGVHKFPKLDSPRFGLVPVVTTSGNGSSADITIVSFVTVYIEGACNGAGCNGNGNNPACVVVTPVKSNVYIPGMAFGGGSISATAGLRTIKLVD
jgi:hypothetical protein